MLTAKQACELQRKEAKTLAKKEYEEICLERFEEKIKLALKDDTDYVNINLYEANYVFSQLFENGYQIYLYKYNFPRLVVRWDSADDWSKHCTEFGYTKIENYEELLKLKKEEAKKQNKNPIGY